MTTEQAIRDLDAEIDSLEQTLDRETAVERKASLAVFFVTAAISVVVLAFVVVNYFHFKTEWTAEKFSGSLRRELDELKPDAVEQLNALGENLLPIYAAESRKQFERLGPVMAERLIEQVNHLGTDLQRDMHERLAASEQRIRERTQEAIFEGYPDLKRDTIRDRLTASFRSITEDAIADALADFKDRFSVDLAKVSRSVDNFAAQDTGVPTIELQKRFLSLWLKQLDQEIQKL